MKKDARVTKKVDSSICATLANVCMSESRSADAGAQRRSDFLPMSWRATANVSSRLHCDAHMIPRSKSNRASFKIVPCHTLRGTSTWLFNVTNLYRPTLELEIQGINSVVLLRTGC